MCIYVAGSLTDIHLLAKYRSLWINRGGSPSATNGSYQFRRVIDRKHRWWGTVVGVADTSRPRHGLYPGHVVSPRSPVWCVNNRACQCSLSLAHSWSRPVDRPGLRVYAQIDHGWREMFHVSISGRVYRSPRCLGTLAIYDASVKLTGTGRGVIPRCKLVGVIGVVKFLYSRNLFQLLLGLAQREYTGEFREMQSPTLASGNTCLKYWYVKREQSDTFTRCHSRSSPSTVSQRHHCRRRQRLSLQLILRAIVHLKGPLSHDRLTAAHSYTREKLRNDTDGKVSRVHSHVHAVMKAALAFMHNRAIYVFEGSLAKRKPVTFTLCNRRRHDVLPVELKFIIHK